jgi:hypothetical protein
MADLPSEASDTSADRAHGIMEWPRIPGYEVEARVGAGGMAVVFRAHDERLRRPVALKVLTPALAAEDGFRRRFIREARAAAMVDDPHIIPVFAAGESDGLLFIAMRFVAGGDVRSLLDRSGAMSAGRATGIVSAVGSALDAAHRAGLVHRDVKPANMLIDVRPGRPDHVYLADFGLSKGALSSGGVTRAGHVVGTPAYLAPEQACGGKVDGRTDQYSLACVAYELLTGVPPFPRDDAAAMVYAHLCEPPPPATARQPSLPSAVDSVLARAMSKNPEQRFLTCQEFAESLRAALGLRPYAADPGLSVHDGARDGALSHGAPVPAVTPDDRDIRIRPRVRRGGRARTRRRVVRLSVAAVALAALALAGVLVAARVARSPGPVPVLIGAYKPVAGQLATVSVGLGGQTLAAGHACSECGTAETDRPLLLLWNGSQWSRLAVPGIPGPARLTGVTASADGTIYVVGDRCLAHCGTQSEIARPLILQWRGGTWSRFAYPSTIKPALLTGVGVTTSGIVFAVGYKCPGGCGTRLSESSDHPFILRSDGSRWWRVTSPSIPDGGNLSAVSTQPDGDAWVVGDACTPHCATLILHWDGSAWRKVASARPGGYSQLLDTSATATSVWASGWYSCKVRCGQPGVGAPTLMLLWNGHSWSPANSPNPGHVNLLTAISGAADGTTWAAELSCTTLCGPPSASPAVFRSALLRWNGSDWSQLRPSPGGHWMLSGIAAEPGGGAVAVGHECLSGCRTVKEVDRTVILRLNGSRWSVVR